jgi:N-acetylmuramoyl-L-alanine amidase
MTHSLVLLGALLAGWAGPPMKVPKPAVVDMPSPNRNSRGKATIDTIVIHHTGSRGTALDVARYFQRRASKVSAHYIVGKAGTIVQSVQEEDRAWHAGKSEFKGRKDVNAFSIGIELVNRGDGKDPYTDRQYRALGHLVAYLRDKYRIPKERITGHKDIALPKGRKKDPSENFSYKLMFKEAERVRQGVR